MTVPRWHAWTLAKDGKVWWLHELKQEPGYDGLPIPAVWFNSEAARTWRRRRPDPSRVLVRRCPAPEDCIICKRLEASPDN